MKPSKELTAHLDICAPFREPAYCWKQYFVTMTITPHRYGSAEPIEYKSDVHKICINHIAWLARKTKATVKRVHSDKAKEFLSMMSALKGMGI